MKHCFSRLLCGLVLCALLVTALPVPASAARFADVPVGHWAAESIDRSASLGFFQGDHNGRFGLGRPMTRAAFTVVLCRFFGWDTDGAAAPSRFTDVPADAWYAGAVGTAFAHGAVTAQSTRFRPNASITREELAVTLIRALGYGPISGLVQDLPFKDVQTNRGYLTMALDLGIVQGVTKTAFSPAAPATREQAAVMLMRLYDRLHSGETQALGVVSSSKDLPDLTQCAAVAVRGGTLTAEGLSEEGQASDIKAIQAAAGDKPQLLYVTGKRDALTGNPATQAAALKEAVTGGQWDGLFLDIAGLNSAADQTALTALAAALRENLGETAQLVLAAEAPSSKNLSGTGYDCAALSKLADKLVLRPASPVTPDAQNTTAPAEPLEEVYRALRKQSIPADKLILWCTSTASCWQGPAQTDTLSGLDMDALLKTDGMISHTSQRFGSIYLVREQPGQGMETIWYTDADGMARRAEMARLFGVKQICFSELSGISPSVFSVF